MLAQGKQYRGGRERAWQFWRQGESPRRGWWVNWVWAREEVSGGRQCKGRRDHQRGLTREGYVLYIWKRLFRGVMIPPKYGLNLPFISDSNTLALVKFLISHLIYSLVSQPAVCPSKYVLFKTAKGNYPNGPGTPLKCAMCICHEMKPKLITSLLGVSQGAASVGSIPMPLDSVPYTFSSSNSKLHRSLYLPAIPTSLFVFLHFYLPVFSLF